MRFGLGLTEIAGLIPHHSALNDVVRRGLSAAGMQFMLEPSGLERGDGKRPDEIIAYHYSRDCFLIWDAACVNASASSNLIRATLAAGPVVDAAEVRKNAILFIIIHKAYWSVD